jgi:hypothetical protein
MASAQVAEQVAHEVVLLQQTIKRLGEKNAEGKFVVRWARASRYCLGAHNLRIPLRLSLRPAEPHYIPQTALAGAVWQAV